MSDNKRHEFSCLLLERSISMRLHAISNKCFLRLFRSRGRPSFKHALIYSPIHASSLYSKHPLAFSVEQRKPFGSEGILSYVRFLRTLPFRIYIPSMLSDTRDKKFKLYVSLHLVPPKKLCCWSISSLVEIEWKVGKCWQIICDFSKALKSFERLKKVSSGIRYLLSFDSICCVMVTSRRLLRSMIGRPTINIYFFSLPFSFGSTFECGGKQCAGIWGQFPFVIFTIHYYLLFTKWSFKRVLIIESAHETVFFRLCRWALNNSMWDEKKEEKWTNFWQSR